MQRFLNRLVDHGSLKLSNALDSRCSFHECRLNKISPSSNRVTDIIEEGQEASRTPSSGNTSLTRTSGTELRNTGNRVEKTISGVELGRRKFWNGGRRSCDHAFDGGVIQEESELIGTLSKQLYLAEAQMQKLQTILKKNEDQLRSKDQEIGRLKRKVKVWEEKSKSQEILHKKEQQERRQQTDQSEYLYKRCLMLEHRIFEMERFLSDYGMIWVGDATDPKAAPPSNKYIETCYEQIAANIEQLNLAAGKDEVYVHRNEKGIGARFKTPPCLSLKFYKNGLIVADGPLRSYNDPAVVSFLRDILDGYFPSELQQTYPTGVPFKIEDRRNRSFKADSRGFPGQGYRLGRQPPVDNALLSITSRKHSDASQGLGYHGSLPKDISADEFNAPQPPSNIRNDCALKSLKSKCQLESPSSEMYALRSQILASHNNICSDTHLQSHINAELGLSSRREKRDVATRSMECDLSTRERALRGKVTSRFPSASRCHHSSTERSSKLSPIALDRGRQRARSASLPNARLTNPRPTPRAKLSSEANAFNFLRTPRFPLPSNPQNDSCVTRSLSEARNSEPPVLHQINEPSGKEGELRLKVRSLNGGIVYLVHVCADESVARLYQLLDKVITRTVPRKYKIVLSGYSPRRLEQLGVSLRESGISRDSVLHLVND